MVGLGGDPADCFDQKLFAIDLRESDEGLYSFEVEWVADCGQSEAYLTAHDTSGDRSDERFQMLADREFDPGSGWHTYRVEAVGSSLRVLVDGRLLLEAEDDRFPTGALVALYSDEVRMSVRGFRVIAL